MKPISDIPEGVRQVSTNASRGSDTLQEIIATGKRAAGAALIATAALVSANCGGGNDTNPEPPVTPPTNPNKPQDINVSYSVPNVVGKAPVPVAVDLKSVGISRLDGAIVNSGQSVECVKAPADDGALNMTATAKQGVADEGTDTCVVTGTTPGAATEPDRVKLDAQITFDTLAPRIQINPNIVVNSDNAGEISLKIDDKNKYTVSFNPALQSSMKYNQGKGVISYAAGTSVYVWNQKIMAIDEAGNASEVQVKLDVAPTPEQPITPPPVTPTCPPGTVPVPPELGGGCV